jgi:photosystem II stability/assembly factor-like uncharacterized protein
MNKKLCCAVALAAGLLANISADDFHQTVKGVKMRHMGPGNGGSMFGVAFKPDNPKVIIFGGDMGATYRTDNGGKSWGLVGGLPKNQPHATFNVKFHPKQNNIVWHAGGSGFSKSVDAGKTWENMNVSIGTCGAIGLDPINSNIVYVAEGMAPRLALNWVKGRIVKTINGGKSWRELARPGGKLNSDSLKQRNYTNIIVDSTSKVIQGAGHSRVYIFGRGGLYRSDNAGKSWNDLSKAFAPGQIADMVLVNKAGKAILFLTATPGLGLAKGGVFKSTDNGQSWQPVNRGLQKIIERLKKRNKKLAKDRNTPLFTLMLAYSPQNPERLYAGSWQGIASSDDLGKTWKEVLPPEGSYVKDRDGVYVAVLKDNKNFKKSLWGGIDQFNRFVAAPSNADIVVFTDNQGLYCSLNGGKTWDDLTFDFGKEFNKNALSQTDIPPNRFTHLTRSRGVQNIVSDQIAIDPFDPKTYYAAYMDLGLEISRDGGEFWEHPTKGLPSRGHAWAVAVDPAKKGRVFVTIGQKWNQLGGIYRSADSGKSWKRIGLKDAEMGVINDIAIDLKSPVDNRTIYLSTEKKGIYKSSDGGNSWQNVFSGQSKAAQNSLGIALTADGKKLYAGTKAGLLVSNDGGKNWKLIKQQLFERVKQLSICKTAPNTIYVVANLPKNNFYWGKAGLFKSMDSGRSWENITPSYMKYAGGIMVNPYNPNYIYACGNLKPQANKNEKVIISRSVDGGRSWQDIGNGIGFARGVNFSMDINNPQHLFVHARFGLIEVIDSQAPKK